MARQVVWIVLFVFADSVLAMINNTQIEARQAVEGPKKTRRSKTRKHRSTSSSEGDVSDESNNESLDMTVSSDSSDDSRSRYVPKSSEERKGWRKWHRKCTPCPEDMAKKWRDPSIRWICGAFQRSRRSFKSLCMMHFRNCQDGTMFTKIHDHRCANHSKTNPHGDHFFYDYRVVLSDDDSDSKTVSDSSLEDSNFETYEV